MNTRIVFAGGGFSGLYAAVHLDKTPCTGHRSGGAADQSREFHFAHTNAARSRSGGSLPWRPLSIHFGAFFVTSRSSKPKWKQSTLAGEDFAA